MNKIRINTLSSEELASILLNFDSKYAVSLSKRVNIEEYSRKLFEYSEIISYYREQDIVGIVAMYCNDLKNKIAYISAILVHPRLRGKYVGDLLISKSKEIAKEKGMEILKLEVKKTNYKAISLYNKKGFTMIKDLNDTIYMELKL